MTHRRDRVIVPLGVVGVLLWSGLLAPPMVAADQEPLPDEVDDPLDEPVEWEPPVSSNDFAWDPVDVAAALDEAAVSGEPVEITSARSEWDSVFAEPSGELTLDTSITAVRTRIGAAEGSWREIDVSLHVTRAGVVPVAPALPLALSSGGVGPLARIGRDGHELELSWPEALPTPTVNGSQATYPDVLPGVDVVVSVFPDGTGFSEVLVVHSPEAAANPAMKKLDLGLEVSPGVEVVADESGGFEVVDDAGEQVFVSPSAVMWDSSGGLEYDVDGSGWWGGADVAAERARRPLEGDRVAEVASEVSSGLISLVPDGKLLTDPDTVWPVFIDPSVSGSRNVWTMIQSAWPTSAAYKFSGTEGLGRCEVAMDWTCNQNNTKRLAWGFGGLSAARGSTVSSATFSAYGAHSWNCTAKSVQVYRIDSINSSSTWNNRSGWGSSRLITWRSVAHKPACDNDRWIEFNVTSAAQWAADNSNSLYLGLRAANESSMTEGWKRYRYDAKLSITYNHPPNKPSGLRATSPTMSGCKASADRPWVNDNTPVLRATISDPNGDNVLGRFSWSKRGSEGTWGSWTYSNSATGASGTERSHQMPTLSDGRYRWRVRGYDGKSYGPYSTGSSSSYCYFTVDTERPAAPAVSIAAPYLFGWWHDPVVGLPHASITVDRGSDSAVDRLRYQVGGGAQTTVSMTSSTKTISFTPTYGVTELRFWLLDKAGNVSTETIRVLKIMSPRVQHAWLFNDGSGTAATDVARPSSRMMDLAVGSGTWASGYRADTISNDPDDTALHFDGTGDGTTTTGPAVFTQDSFTATARVKLDQMEGGTFVAVSQDGVQNSAFKLGYNTTLGSWAAWFHPTDTAGGGWVRLDSGLAPIDEGNEELPPFPDGKPDWQHLALVHDAAAEEVRLLVDGNIAATMSTTDILDWDSSGSLRIGRGQTDGSSMGTGSGKVDDVFVFDSALTEAQIRRVAFSVEDELQVEPIRDEILIAGRAAAWPLDDGQGQSAVDSTGSGHDMSLGADTRWVPGRHAANNPSDRAVSFPGTDDGYGVTADPVLDTTESYSVSAWVQVPASVSQGAVLSQFGDNSSGTLLTFSPTNDAWRFGKHKSDQVEDAGWNVVHSAGPPVRAQWTHLVGVYDAEAGRFRLYVDGLMQDAVESTPAWAAGGAFNIGRYLYKGNPSLRWNGVIDDVRVYQRVLSPAEIAYLGREELS